MRSHRSHAGTATDKYHFVVGVSSKKLTIRTGYDHFVGGIGGALAGYYGADFLCYLTPAEHLSLPDLDDVKEGVIATRIAAHAADIARGIDREHDKEFSKARENLDWDIMFNLCINPEKAKVVLERGIKIMKKLENYKTDQQNNISKTAKVFLNKLNPKQ